jgi:hypothetical protein
LGLTLNQLPAEFSLLSTIRLLLRTYTFKQRGMVRSGWRAAKQCRNGVDKAKNQSFLVPSVGGLRLTNAARWRAVGVGGLLMDPGYLNLAWRKGSFAHAPKCLITPEHAFCEWAFEKVTSHHTSPSLMSP